MAARYAPLVLLGQRNATPTNYPSKIITLDNTSSHTAQQHVDRMNDFFDVQEVDEADVKMRLCRGGVPWVNYGVKITQVMMYFL